MWIGSYSINSGSDYVSLRVLLLSGQIVPLHNQDLEVFIPQVSRFQEALVK